MYDVSREELDRIPNRSRIIRAVRVAWVQGLVCSLLVVLRGNCLVTYCQSGCLFVFSLRNEECLSYCRRACSSLKAQMMVVILPYIHVHHLEGKHFTLCLNHIPYLMLTWALLKMRWKYRERSASYGLSVWYFFEFVRFLQLWTLSLLGNAVAQ
jgi:hypothetical protein